MPLPVAVNVAVILTTVADLGSFCADSVTLKPFASYAGYAVGAAGFGGAAATDPNRSSDTDVEGLGAGADEPKRPKISSVAVGLLAAGADGVAAGAASPEPKMSASRSCVA